MIISNRRAYTEIKTLIHGFAIAETPVTIRYYETTAAGVLRVDRLIYGSSNYLYKVDFQEPVTVRINDTTPPYEMNSLPVYIDQILNGKIDIEIPDFAY